MDTNYFPLGIADSQNFCNRVEEKKRLLFNFEQTQPTLILSPRRYGKTSLALQAIKLSKLPSAKIDFFAQLTEHDILTAILNGIAQLFHTLHSSPHKALALATDFFASLHVKLVIERLGVHIEINKAKQRPADIIADTLTRLEQYLNKHKLKTILFFDEFQVLGQVADDHSIEAVLRGIAQQSKAIIFLFSGSNRHILSRIFDDSSRPFYKLCDKLILDRISRSHYHQHLNKYAKKRWQQPLADSTIEQILDLTQNHSYYVNALCYRLWLQDDIANEEVVRETWHQYALEERAAVSKELDLLSPNQAKFLISLARFGKTKKITGDEFTKFVNVPSGSIRQAATSLQNKDYLYVDKDGFTDILDPLLKYILHAE